MKLNEIIYLGLAGLSACLGFVMIGANNLIPGATTVLFSIVLIFSVSDLRAARIRQMMAEYQVTRASAHFAMVCDLANRILKGDATAKDVKLEGFIKQNAAGQMYFGGVVDTLSDAGHIVMGEIEKKFTLPAGQPKGVQFHAV